MTACLNTTANSIEDLSWSRIENVSEMRNALLLDCPDVTTCHSRNLYPDKYNVEDNTEELYIWTKEYVSGNYLFYVVVNRPNENTWDGIGFENIDGSWTLGVYGGEKFVAIVNGVSIYVPEWFQIETFDNNVVLGFRSERWAVVVHALTTREFEYKVIMNYW